MDKKIPIAVAVVAVAAAGVAASHFTGKKIEERLQAESTKWQQALPFVKVLDDKYERGLFSATHSARIQIGCDSAATGGSAPLVLVLRERIAHGPLPGMRALGAAVIDSELTLDGAHREALQKAIGSEIKPITLHTTVGFGGDWRSEYDVPKLVAAITPQEQFVFEGLKGFVETHGKVVRYEGTMPGFEMHDQASGASLKMTGITSRGEGEPIGEVAWLVGGKGSGEVAGVEFRMPSPNGGEPVVARFADMKSTVDTVVDKELMGTKVLFSGNGDVAGVKVDRFEAQVSMQRVHVPSYEKMLGQILGGATCGGPAGMDPEAAMQMQLVALQSAAAALLPHDPVYSLDHLKATIAGKEGSLAYSFGSQGVTADDLNGGDIAALISKLVVKADAAVPMAWIETVMTVAARRSDPNAGPMPPGALSAMIDAAAQKGFVRRDGEIVRAGIEMTKGAFTLNGQPMALPVAAFGQPGAPDAEPEEEADEEAEPEQPKR